jgi:hypothetical protein
MSSGVIRIEESEKGDLTLVAGSPLFLNTFKQMMYNATIRKGMEQMVLDAEYMEWSTEALKLEEDLSKIGGSSIADDMEYNGRVGLATRKSQLAHRLGELSDLISKNRKAKASL